MKFFRTLILLALILGGFQWYSTRNRPSFTNRVSKEALSRPPQNPWIIPCRGETQRTRLHFNSTLKLNLRFVEKGAEKKTAALNAAKEQLRFLTGYLKHSSNILRYGTILQEPEEPSIKILKMEPAKYGQSLEIDKKWSTLTNPYIDHALSQARTLAEDPALEVTYSAELSALACWDGTPPNKVYIDLPIDPYLAFWMISPSERRPLTFNGQTETTNYCAFSEMAELKAPSFYWYVWNPQAQGRDLQSQYFDCTKRLAAGVHFSRNSTEIEILPSQKQFVLADVLAKKEHPDIRGTIIFGTLAPWTLEFNAEETFQLLGQGNGDLVKNLRKLDKNLRNEQTPRDPSLAGLVHLLLDLAEHIQINSYQLTKNADHILFQINSRLKDSQRAFDLIIYYGVTDVDTKKTTAHWKTLLNSFQNDDFVFYIGHSGMGSNLNLDQMQKSLSLKEEEFAEAISKRPYFLYSVIGCEAFSYYGREVEKIRSKKMGNITDLVLMGNSSYRYLIPSAFIQYVDQLILGKVPALPPTFKEQLTANDKIVFSRAGAAL